MFNLNEGLLAFFNAPLYIAIPLGVLVLLIAYLLGSINSAIIVSKAIYGEDVRTKGSGNAGMTNMLRNYGMKAAALTLIGDLGKTVLAIAVAGLVFGFWYTPAIISISDMCYLAGLFAVLGHIFPVYYKFKGGKGVLATATMVLFLSPIVFLILLAVFVLLVGFTRYVSLGSVSVAVLYPVVLRGYFSVVTDGKYFMSALVALSVIILACLIVWCHRANLVRIGNRTESKLSFGKKKEAPVIEDSEAVDDTSDVEDVSAQIELEAENGDGEE